MCMPKMFITKRTYIERSFLYNWFMKLTNNQISSLNNKKFPRNLVQIPSIMDGSQFLIRCFHLNTRFYFLFFFLISYSTSYSLRLSSFCPLLYVYYKSDITLTRRSINLECSLYRCIQISNSLYLNKKKKLINKIYKSSILYKFVDHIMKHNLK